MGDSVCLQPWVSIAGNGNTVLQDEACWVDVSGYQGVVIYLEVAFVNNQASQTNLDIQAAPSRDEVFFGASFSGGNPWVASFPFTTSPPTGVQALVVRRWTDSTTSTTPPEALLRWRVRFPAVDTSITFRIWLNLLRSAGYAESRPRSVPRGGRPSREPPSLAVAPPKTNGPRILG